MGSFRSQPDLTKHTETKPGVGLTYVSTHMCGNLYLLLEVGEYIWKTHILLNLHYQEVKILSLLSSMVMEVLLINNSGAEVSKFVERHFVQ